MLLLSRLGPALIPSLSWLLRDQLSKLSVKDDSGDLGGGTGQTLHMGIALRV